MENAIISLGHHWNTIQKSLFPRIEDELGELDEKQRAFVNICELIIDDKAFIKYRWSGNGRPPCARKAFFKAFILKALWNLPSTRATILLIRSSPTLRRLCGWESLGEIPNESTFSRAFAMFAEDGIASIALSACTTKALGNNGVFHVSYDSTAIDAREQGSKREKEKRSWSHEDKRTYKQRNRDAETNFKELPKTCDWGRKFNSKGRIIQWRGYKLHVAVGDGDIPLTACLTSASLHDSQAIIPMMQQTSKSFFYFYDLADSAYDANDILETSILLGHKPLIEANPRKDKIRHVSSEIMPIKKDSIGPRITNIIPAEDLRYRIRTNVERVFSHLHDAHGGKNIMVRGNEKVLLHLMFGLLVIAAEQILKLVA